MNVSMDKKGLVEGNRAQITEDPSKTQSDSGYMRF